MRMQEFSSWDALTERRQSEELDQLLRGDFRCIESYLRDVMAHTDLEVRKIPFVRRYAAELAGLYQRPVVRRFVVPSNPAELPTQAWQKLGEVYADAGVDAAMSTLEHAIWLQQSVACLVMPSGLGVRLRPVSPWQMEVKVADPLNASSPDGWAEVQIQVPDRIDAESGTVTYGIIRLTPTTAWVERAGSRRGLYRPDGGHDYGRIPLAVAHLVDPVDGHVFAPVNEPAHNLQVALCRHESETELVVRHSAWPQKVIENAGIAQETETLQVGPDKVIALTRSGDPAAPGPRMTVVQGQLPVSELASYIEGRIKLYCAMLGIDPSAFLRVNTAVTVSARMFADATRREMRDRVRPTLMRFERDIARLVGWVVNGTGAVSIPWRPLDVDIRWQDWAPSPDPVADTTAMRARMELGTDSPVDYVAQRDGISRTAALTKVQETLAEVRMLGLVADPHEAAESTAVEQAEEAPDAGDDADQRRGDGRDDGQAAGAEGGSDSEGDGAGAL